MKAMFQIFNTEKDKRRFLAKDVCQPELWTLLYPRNGGLFCSTSTNVKECYRNWGESLLCQICLSCPRLFWKIWWQEERTILKKTESQCVRTGERAWGSLDMGSVIEALERSKETSAQEHPGWGSVTDTGKMWRRVMPLPGRESGKLQAIKAAHFCI